MISTLRDQLAQAASDIGSDLLPPPLSVLVRRARHRRARHAAGLAVVAVLLAGGTATVLGTADHPSRSRLGPADGVPAVPRGSFELRQVLEAGPAAPSTATALEAPYTAQAYADLGCARPATGVQGTRPTSGQVTACSVDGLEKYVLGDAAVTESDIASTAVFEEPTGGHWVVIVGFNPAGTRRLLTLTAAAVGKRIAVVVDGLVRLAPSVPAAATDTSLRIPAADQTEAVVLAGALLAAHGVPSPRPCLGGCPQPARPPFAVSVTVDGHALPPLHQPLSLHAGKQVNLQVTVSVPPGWLVTRVVIGAAGDSYGVGPAGLEGFDTILIDSHAFLAGTHTYAVTWDPTRLGHRNLVSAIYFQRPELAVPSASTAEEINIGSFTVT